ncbi:MAG: hypothetical protein DI598_11290 [Pseudopedobacter saltans]|uniref:Quercetin 2,3-dioxygenase C-terminal cupin domain-containing protein n=1 Tax=Pseudopedobacter saltans TaxID=151895 RepID=A0A2W5EV21_9SPHI|nr:MAG: hypothetical protein DI598_11290 [Pseudopedobacter saltans]
MTTFNMIDMETQIANKMYIASQRGILRSVESEIFPTLNYGDYQNTDKRPIGALSNFLEVNLFAYKDYQFSFDRNTLICIVQLYNSVELNGGGYIHELIPGQVAVMPGAQSIKVENPNEENASFILFTLEIGFNYCSNIVVEDLSFNTIKNQFQSLSILPNVTLACFDRRNELLFHKEKIYQKVFLYNLNGAFEADGCLVGPKDGLLIEKGEPFEIESFEPNTIVLAIML